MNRILKRALFLAVCMLVASSAAVADQRILLSFDHVGHELKRIVRTSSTKRNFIESVEPQQAIDIESLYPELTPGIVTLVWTDADGFLQATTTAPDPRISRGPRHIEGLDKSLQVVNEGAWLVSGPQEASRLIILMAEYKSLDLPFARWEIELIY